MPNENYKSLIYSNFDALKKNFIDAKEIFKNAEVKNNLLHAGEYGSYREKICKNIIKACIPGRFSISDGFVINSKNDISNQLDLIIFDEREAPFINFDDQGVFYPVETVVGIGEIKSSITTSNLCEALIKLSKQKDLKSKMVSDTYCINERGRIADVTNCPYDNIFTFIICEAISDLDLDKFESILRRFYIDNNVSLNLRHNLILSLKDGLFGYIDKDSKLQAKTKAVIGKSFLYFPSSHGVELHYALKEGREAEKTFLSSIANFVVQANTYYPEPSEYL